MSGITTSNLMINGISAQTLSENATTEREQAKQAGEALGPLSISSDSMKVSAGSQAQPTDSEDSGESEAVTELRQLIKDLQKQLVEEQKQLAALQNSKMDDAAKRLRWAPSRRALQPSTARSWLPRRSYWSCCSKRVAAARAGWSAPRPDCLAQ